MGTKLYCDLYVSECWKGKKEKLIRKLRAGRLMPRTYIVTLSRGEQNNLEFYSAMFLKQRFYDDSEIFIVALADGYDECLVITERIAKEVYRKTGGADIRNYILERQREYERAGQ